MKDLALLVADKNMEFTMRGLLGRHLSLAVRPLSFEIKVHPGRDGGVRRSGAAALRPLRSQFQHALLMLDWEGSGADETTAVALEQSLDAQLAPTWGGHGKAIVIDPEVDVWVWGSDNLMQSLLEWHGLRGIRDWLLEQEFELGENAKPKRPKEAFEKVMSHLEKPRSSYFYGLIAGRISLERCEDPAFGRLQDALKGWFGSSLRRSESKRV